MDPVETWETGRSRTHSSFLRSYNIARYNDTIAYSGPQRAIHHALVECTAAEKDLAGIDSWESNKLLPLLSIAKQISSAK